MKYVFPCFLVALFYWALQGCYYDVEEELYPLQFCDTTTMSTYAAKVAPILDQHCTGCHGGNSPTASVSLDNYNGVKTQADNGQLFCTISHGSGCSPMPDDAPQIPSCDILTIQRWIANGAQND